jgi:predicted TIM-barrel fold metal-dependent hydrolase
MRNFRATQICTSRGPDHREVAAMPNQGGFKSPNAEWPDPFRSATPSDWRHPLNFALKVAATPSLLNSMFTRRDVLLGSLAAGVMIPIRSAFGKAAQPATPVNFDVPAGACDCHTHIHVEQFPFFAGRGYTPEMATPDEMSALHKALRIQRVVIVQPSVYGTDNSATLFGMKARGSDARGIAVIDDNTSDSDLDAMAKAGIRGIRLTLLPRATDRSLGRKRFQAALARVRPRNWHIQIFTDLAMISALKDEVAVSPVPVVFDHFGRAQASLGLDQPGFSDLLALIKLGKAYVKVSAAYRVSKLAPDYSDVAPLARELVAANPDRVLWGTNWPHPNGEGGSTTKVSPLFQVDDGRLLNQLPLWAPDSAVRRKILVENPARLYGF